MKKLIALTTILFAFVLGATYIKADSPITSTPFYTEYNDVSMVNYAEEAGVLDKKIAKFLMSKKNAVAEKLAVCNALGWSIDGKKNATLFTAFLKKKYKWNSAPDWSKLTDDELICVAYLTALDDYFHPKKAVPMLDELDKRSNTNYSVNMIEAIIRAQIAFDSDWCQVWRLAEAVENNKTLTRDLHESAIDIIIEYMELYADDCK